MNRQAEGATVTVANGLPVIEIPVAHRPETAIGVAFAAGARHEREDEIGVSGVLVGRTDTSPAPYSS